MNNKKILVVEDEVIVAQDIVQTLKSLGYQVSGFLTTGEEALQKSREEKPDLILMDIMLSADMDGVKTAESINRELDIPVVYLTAYSNNQVFEKAKTSRPYGYIVKPFDELNLYTTIETAIYKHSVQMNLVSETENALASIFGCIEILLEDTESLSDDTRDKIELIKKATDKIENSIKKL